MTIGARMTNRPAFLPAIQRLPYPVLFCLLICCEQTPYVVTVIELPAGTKVEPEQVHLEVDSSSSSVFVPHYAPCNVDSASVVPSGIEVTFRHRFGRTTYVFARVWIDVDRDGKPSSGDLVGDLTPAPFPATDPGMFSCGTNLNRAPAISTRRIP